MRKLQVLVCSGAVSVGGLWLGAPPAGAVTNSPTTRDCSILAIPGVFGGFDPDFIRLSGVSVGPGGALTATGSTVQLLGSESLVPADQMMHTTFKATVTAPGTTTATFSGSGTGHVTFAIPLAAGHTYTISWSAVFDGGFHPCPGLLTPANLRSMPFVVHAAPRASRKPRTDRVMRRKS